MNTKATPKNYLGYALMALGLVALGFNKEIVSTGLERLLGIQVIVGKENVIYRPDGSYYYTNPHALAMWMLAVAMIGVPMQVVGVWLSGIRIKFPSKRGNGKPS